MAQVGVGSVGIAGIGGRVQEEGEAGAPAPAPACRVSEGRSHGRGVGKEERLTR